MSPALVLLSLAHAGPGDFRYTQADVLTLRSGPSASADVRASLRIATRVEQLDQRDDGWTRVRVSARPEAFPLEGWVHQDYIDYRTPTVSGLLDGIDARPPHEQLRQLERALALEDDPVLWDAMGSVVEELARVDPAQDWERRARLAEAQGVDELVWIAECRDGRAWFVGGLMPESGEIIVIPDYERLLPLGRTLSRQRWLRAEDDGVQVLTGADFATPFLVPRWNETGERSRWGSSDGDSIGPGGMEISLILGACTQDGPLTTAPLRRLSTDGGEPTSWAAEMGFPTDGKLDLRVGEDVAELGRRVDAIWYGCGGEGEEAPAREVRVQTPHGLAAWGAGIPTEGPDWSPKSSEPSTWLHSPAHPGLRVGIAASSWEVGSGSSVIVVSSDAVQVRHIVSESWGC